MQAKAQENVNRVSLIYHCTAPTLMQFHASVKDKRLILGAIGSGKTTACCQEIFRMARDFPPCKDNVRRSTACFVRDTTTNLSDTTMKTWLGRFPEDPTKPIKHFTNITSVNWSNPMEMRVVLPLEDGTIMDLTIYCRHQACAADAENLKSLDLSFGFVNEMTGVPKESVDMLYGRLGRFPSKSDFKVDPTSPEALEIDPYTGRNRVPEFKLVADSNMPPDDHWIYDIAEVSKPDDWGVFKQPPAILCHKFPDGKVRYTPNKGQRISQGVMPAECIDHHSEGWKYYAKQIKGKSHDWIKVFLMAEYGTFTEGQPVYPDFSDSVNYVDCDIPFDIGKTLFLAFDWGLWPSASFVQMGDGGQFQIIDEIDGEGIKMGIQQLWETRLRERLINDYRWGSGAQIFAVGDPAVGTSQVDMSSCVSYLETQGLTVIPCYTNDPAERIEAVNHFLHRVADKGKPGLVVAKKAQKIRKGFNGGYFFKQMTQHRDKVYSGTPCKNSFSHLADTVQYNAHVVKNPALYNVDFRNRGLVAGYASISGSSGPLLNVMDMSNVV